MCEWDDHGGGEEGAGAEADHRSSERDVGCLLDTGKGEEKWQIIDPD